MNVQKKKLGKVSSVCCNPDLGKKHTRLLPPQAGTSSPDPVLDPEPLPWTLAAVVRSIRMYLKSGIMAHSVQEEHLFLSCLPLTFAGGQQRLRRELTLTTKPWMLP